MAPVNTKGQRPGRHRHRTLLVVDDYGNAVGYSRRCTSCERWKPLSAEHFWPSRARKEATRFQRICKVCTVVGSRMEYRRDPERGRAAARAYYAANRERAYELAKARRARMSPEKRRASYRRRAARAAEEKRIDRILAAMDQGGDPEHLAELSRQRCGDRLKDEGAGRVPAAPLVAELDRLIAERDRSLRAQAPDGFGGMPTGATAQVCTEAQVHERRLSDWRKDGAGADADYALAVCERLGLEPLRLWSAAELPAWYMVGLAA